MTRSILDVLTQAVDGAAVDLADHALGDLAGTDVALALELGWASLPPELAAQLTPPDVIAADLDAGASDVLAAVLVHPPELSADIVVDERWGAGGDDVGPPSVAADLDAETVDAASPWGATHDLDELDVGPSEAPESVVAHDADEDLDDDPDPWDDDLLT
jgi:hypothetical protein